MADVQIIAKYTGSNPDTLFRVAKPGETVALVNGGTGVSSLALAKVALGVVNNLSSLNDTAIGTPTNGQSLVWNGTTWAASTVDSGGAGATALSALTDTSIASPTNNDVLTWDGSNWVAAAPPGAGGGEANTGSNIGGGPGSSFSSKVGTDLQFRTLSGVNITVTTTGNVIQLSSTSLSDYVLSATNNALSSNVSNHIASASVHFTEASIDHGSIAGLADNDHPQYVLSATNTTLSSLVTSIQTSTVNLSDYIAANESTWNTDTGVTDHGALTGLADNDHPQYVLSATNTTLSSNVSNHISDTANPHSVTPTQVGNTTAQWNASSLLGIPMDLTGFGGDTVLGYAAGSAVPVAFINVINSEVGPGITVSGDGGTTVSVPATNVILVSSTPIQLIPTLYKYASATVNYVSDNTISQQLFDTNGNVDVDASSLYEFTALIRINKSTNSSNVQFGFSGTATISTIEYCYVAQNSNDNSTGTGQNSGWTVVSTVNAVGSANTNNTWIKIFGTLVTGTGGALCPIIRFSGLAVNPQLQIGSFIKFVKFGADSETSRGTWS